MASQIQGLFTLFFPKEYCLNNTILRVSSAVVQRYLDKILDAALSQAPQIQGAAVDILTFTIKQGLAHPLQVRLDECAMWQ